MLNFNIFEKLHLNFFCFGSKHKQMIKDEQIDKKIYESCKEQKITILPIAPNFDIENLYPITDHVELWNIFIIGNDKTYILAHVKDPFISIPNSDDLLNKQGQNILPDELVATFDGLWSKTLLGRQLQFYMAWNNHLYFVNTYPFFNGKNKVIGACLFMRSFDAITEANFDTISTSPKRASVDYARIENRPDIHRSLTDNTNYKHEAMRAENRASMSEYQLKNYMEMTTPNVSSSRKPPRRKTSELRTEVPVYFATALK